jgi:hypothetical protein
MTIKNGKINSLNVLGLRRVDFPAHHFVYTDIPKYNHHFVEKLDDWINTNLNGRYYIGQNIIVSESNAMIYTTKIGFENEKEMSFFTLACPDLT